MPGDYAGLVEEVARALSIPQHHTGWPLLTSREQSLYLMQATAILPIIEREKATAIEALTRPAQDSVALVKVGLEAAAKVADEGNVHWRDKAGVTANKRESRDYETMAIACAHVAPAIRALDPAAIAAVGVMGWLDIASAPRDGTYIIVRVHEHSAQWAGRCFVSRHEGVSSGYDLGWALFPGYGGVPDDGISHWMPLPAPPERLPTE